MLLNNTTSYLETATVCLL